MVIKGLMKKIIFVVLFSSIVFSLTAQQFRIPPGATLIESTEFKNNGIPYMVEQRYRLSSGEILYVYYDVEGVSSVTIQRIEQVPILAIGENINIPGLPGYREFNFGDDRRRLVQFMKIFNLGFVDFWGIGREVNLSDNAFNPISGARNEFILLLDLYDETWILEHFGHYSSSKTTRTTQVVRLSR